MDEKAEGGRELALVRRGRWDVAKGVIVGVVGSSTVFVIFRTGIADFLASANRIIQNYGGLVGFAVTTIAAMVVGVVVHRTYKEKVELETDILRLERDIRRERRQTAQDEKRQTRGAAPDPLGPWDSDSSSARRVFMGPEGPMSQGRAGASLFGLRMSHFAEEKQTLCSTLAEALFIRAKSLCESHGKNVVVIIDSGTTLYPLFEHFGRRLTQEVVQNDAAREIGWWGNSLRIITNSIAGIESLILHGRTSSENRYSEIAGNVEMVAGTPLAVYSASVGPLAIRHIESLAAGDRRDVASRATRIDYDRELHIIALTTGNYIFLDGSGRPVPLARGEGHKEFKSAICKKAHEVIVVGPLGKFILEGGKIDLAGFNRDLHYEEGHWQRERLPYEAVDLDGVNNIRALTTWRHAGLLFSNHSTAVLTRLGNETRRINNVGDMEKGDNLASLMSPEPDPCHLMTLHGDLPPGESQQLLREVPHENLRHPDLLTKYFRVGE